MDMLEKNEVVQFKDNEFVLDVNVSSKEETVWLNQQQIAELFDRDIKTIGKHLKIFLRKENWTKMTQSQILRQLLTMEKRIKLNTIN